MLNKIIIQGRLVRDPELRYTQSQVPVSSFTVAVDRDYADHSGNREADFIDCSAWRGTGEFVNKYFAKGSMIIVSGRLQSRKWTDREGGKRTSWEIVADSVYFGGSKRIEESAEPRSDSNAPVPEYKGPEQQKFVDLGEDDGELPFD